VYARISGTGEGDFFACSIPDLRRSPDVPILAAARLPKSLGNSPPNSVKFFATAELVELMKERAWLAKVTNALNQHWQWESPARKNLLADDLAGAN
jgi:hypothetical protein